MAKNSFGAIIINNGVDTLKTEIRRALPFTSVSIIGNSGIGKTHLVEELCEDESFGIDEFVTLRLQGVSSEDFRLPILNTITKTKNGEQIIEKEVEFAKMGVFKRIEDNPDKVFLLLLDEITRASRDVVPMLFSILERKSMDGKLLQNVRIITAFNYGGDYISNFDFSDDALRRRQIFLEYQPNKQDFVDFIIKNNYHPTIIEMAEDLPLSIIIDHETTEELMQPTTFGSWKLLNKRWETIEKELGRELSYEECKEDINSYGSFYFTDKTLSEIFNKLSLMEQLNQIDLQVEIIEKNGLEYGRQIVDKHGNIFKKEGKEKEILIRVMNFIKNQTLKDEMYFANNIDKILDVYNTEQTLMVTVIQTIIKSIENKYKGDIPKMNKVKNDVFQSAAIKINKKAKEDEKFKELLEGIKEAQTVLNKR